MTRPPDSDLNKSIDVPSVASADQLQKPIGTGVFISYRRHDSADISGRIYDRLVGKFSKEIIYKDVDSIPLGADFKEHLEKSVTACKVLLAIIGQQWLTIRDEQSGRRRLDDPADFVRIEVETALNNNVIVIPVLVHGTMMPTSTTLPVTLNKLAYRNATVVRPDPDFHHDVDRIVKALEDILK